MIGLQNAGKTSLLRVLAVSCLILLIHLAANVHWSGRGVHHRVRLALSLAACAKLPLLTQCLVCSSIPTVGFNMKRVQRGHVTLKWYGSHSCPLIIVSSILTSILVGTLEANHGSDPCGSVTVGESTRWCMRHRRQAVCGRNKLTRFQSYIVDAADHQALPIAREELHALLEKPVLDGIPLLVLGNKSDLPEKLSVDELIEALDLKSVSHREVSCYGISAKEETNLDAVLQWLIKRSSK